MVKIIGPLFSEEAKGVFANTLFYGKQNGVNFAKMLFNKVKRRAPLQSIQRTIFKEGMEAWKLLGPVVQSLWHFQNRLQPRQGRCDFLTVWMLNHGEPWNLYPIPRNINTIDFTDRIASYSDFMDDVEELTGLLFCDTPEVYYMAFVWYGMDGISFLPGYFWGFPQNSPLAFDKPSGDLVIYRELAHCLLMQHGFPANHANTLDHGFMAQEVAVRCVAGDLTPVYTYQGKTFSEWAPDSCPA